MTIRDDYPPRCKTCERRHSGQWPEGEQVTSPTGVEHVQAAFGVTLCGKDASGAGWWWQS